MKSKKRRALGVGLLLVLAAAGAVAYTVQGEAGSWVRVERGDLVVGVEVEGELRAVESAIISPPQMRHRVDFKIAWMAPEGSQVRADEPVLRFDTTQIDRSLQQFESQMESAQKNLEKKETDVEIERRQQELQMAEAEASLRKANLRLDVPAAASARAELEKARIDKRLAEIEIKALRSKLEYQAEKSRADLAAFRDRRDRARHRLARLQEEKESMTIKAPRDGTLIYASNWRGEKKKVGDSVWRAEKLMEIPDLARMMADGSVVESRIGNVAVGQRVTLRLDAHPDREYVGRVSTIRRSVQRRSRRNPQKHVRLEIEIESTDTERMRPGMRFRGEIEVERVVDTLLVPQDAVFPRPGGAVVFVRTLTGKRQVKPTFGARNQKKFGIVEGLEEGDWVERRAHGEEG